TDIGTYALGNISESALWAYGGIEMNLGKWMINPAVRVDWFQFSYADKTATKYSDPNKHHHISSSTSAVPSPGRSSLSGSRSKTFSTPNGARPSSPPRP
ncbi:MAG: TonB-dependent receptor, partial [Muribaculaceae bacterium]|nr:TonB-dependent receptor [Muribaculaceae bacterium]